ncbi:MAG: HAMP domain-containing sensor histidine kinase [Aestuariivirga sp.]
MKTGSLRLRLLVAAAFSIAAALLAAGIALTALFEQQVRDRVMQELNNDLLQLVGAIEVSDTGDVKVIRALADPRFESPYSGKYWRIEQMSPAPSSLGPLLRSRSLWDSEPTPAGSRLGPEGEPLVIAERTIEITTKQGNISLRLRVEAHEDEITAPLANFRNQLVLYLSLIGLALTIAAWVQVSIGLRPLQTLRKQLSELRASSTKRLNGEFPTEVEPLVSEFNDVLNLRDKSLERARHRAGDLAHGLMTPLTILSAVARDLNKRKLIKQATEIDSQVESMRRHVERGLTRARLSTGRGHDLTNLAEATDAVVSTLRRLPEANGLEWLSSIPLDAAVPIERNDLLELLGNLLDNARKFAKSQVKISFVEGSIVVEDDGPGVADAELSSIRQRGRKLDESRKGFGLGLAIVEDIAGLYELELSYGRAASGGLQVKIAFDLKGAAA